jgi:hypothetical protein
MADDLKPKKKRVRTEREMEMAREYARQYRASGKAKESAIRNADKRVILQVVLHRGNDADLFELFEDGKPSSGQTKELLRELIRLRSTVGLWQKAAKVLSSEDIDG